MKRAYCPSTHDNGIGHWPDEVAVYFYHGYPEVGVLIDGATGRCTNRYEDGTVGVPRDTAEIAEQIGQDIDGAVCLQHHTTIEWRPYAP